jgi:cation diffusion facilitator CzcD-associated flavoprotein CzcO
MSRYDADIAIVGAGPIGLELAAAFKRIGADYIHFDAHQIGYTISWWPRQTPFFSTSERVAIAGIPILASPFEKISKMWFAVRRSRRKVSSRRFGVEPFLRRGLEQSTPSR